jgi:hypothetical protein
MTESDPTHSVINKRQVCTTTHSLLLYVLPFSYHPVSHIYFTLQSYSYLLYILWYYYYNTSTIGLSYALCYLYLLYRVNLFIPTYILCLSIYSLQLLASSLVSLVHLIPKCTYPSVRVQVYITGHHSSPLPNRIKHRTASCGSHAPELVYH